MPENKFHPDFNIPTVADWEKVARQELKDENPWQRLAKEVGGIAIKPFYDEADLRERRIIEIQNTGTGWINAPLVLVNTSKEANDHALNHLNSGADGIYFQVAAQQDDLRDLLNSIALPHCSVFFEARQNPEQFLNSFSDFACAKRDTGIANGAFFWEGTLSADLDFSKLLLLGNFRAAGIAVAEKENIVDEIVDALCSAVDFIDTMTKNKLTTEQALRLMAFSVRLQAEFFLSIIKIRALKNLWVTFQEAYATNDPLPAFVHVFSSMWQNERFQPHENLLKQSTASMASIFGGCDAITVETEDADNTMMSRLGRNVSSILQEEAFLGKVSDPLAGSFFIESLTDQVASTAWKKFQQRV